MANSNLLLQNLEQSLNGYSKNSPSLFYDLDDKEKGEAS